MGIRIGASVLAIAVAASLVACTAPDRVVAGSTVTVAVTESLTTLNPDTSQGRTVPLNADIASLTRTGFAYADDAYGIVRDASFGTAEITAEDPLTVRYTLARDLTWSDGVPVTPTDLLLAWAGNSGALNTPDVDVDALVDPESGALGELPGGVVYFDGARGRGLELATQTPQLGDDGRSLFVHFDEFTPGWEMALAPVLPAHVVASRALDLPLHENPDADPASDPDRTSAEDATTALRAAILDDDVDVLRHVADEWNSGFDLDGSQPDAALLVANGPYRITEVTSEAVTLQANPRYRGDRRPVIESIVIRTVDDADSLVAGLTSGDIDIATPDPDPELVARLEGIGGVSVVAGASSTFEHLDLQFADSKSGRFDDPLVREAFLRVVPRQAILDEVVTPVQADAALLDSFVLRPGADGYDDAVAANGSADFAQPDVDAAVTLLEKAGLRKKPEVCILYDPKDATRAAEFALIRDAAEPAGFRVTDCSRRDWRGMLGVAGAYDAALFAWDTARLGPSGVAAVFDSASDVANLNHYANPDADAAIERATGSADPAAQTAALVELDGILWDDAYGLPLYAHPMLTVVSDRVEGVTRSPLARGVFWNAWEWKPAASEIAQG